MCLNKKEDQQDRFAAWQKAWRQDRVTGLRAWHAALEYNDRQIERDESRTAFGNYFQTMSGPEGDWELIDTWCAALNYADAVARATGILGSREAALEWMRKPSMSLNQRMPLAALWLDPQLVDELLNRLESDGSCVTTRNVG